MTCRQNVQRTFAVGPLHPLDAVDDMLEGDFTEET